jgi:hypothetical protein
MRLAWRALLVMVTSGVASVALGDGTHPVFRSVDVDLPFGERQFDGPGADAVNGNCLACHSAGMILTQPPQTRDTWTRLVNKMRQAYKAPISDADVGSIVDYLMRVRGSESSGH